MVEMNSEGEKSSRIVNMERPFGKQKASRTISAACKKPSFSRRERKSIHTWVMGLEFPGCAVPALDIWQEETRKRCVNCVDSSDSI